MENGTTANPKDDAATNEAGSAETEQGNKKKDNAGAEEASVDEGVVKMRGLPWSATVEDILEFLGKLTTACVYKGVQPEVV